MRRNKEVLKPEIRLKDEEKSIQRGVGKGRSDSGMSGISEVESAG